MEAAQQAVLGLRADRSASKPTKVDDVYTGGTEFERHEQALNVRNAPRCYTLAQSYQVPRNLVGPTAGAKVNMGEEPSAHLKLREQVIKVRVTEALLSILHSLVN